MIMNRAIHTNQTKREDIYIRIQDTEAWVLKLHGMQFVTRIYYYFTIGKLSGHGCSLHAIKSD